MTSGRFASTCCVPGWLLLAAVFLHGCGGTARAPVSSPGVYHATKPPVVSAGHRSRAEQRAIPESGHHVVSRGDTLYAIAWRYHLDYRDVARWNGIRPPYLIYPGDKIQLRRPPTSPISRQARTPSPPLSKSGQTPSPPIEQAQRQPPTRQPAADKASSSVATAGPIKWSWPTEGQLIKTKSPTAEKGIKIGGRNGQNIHAAAPGQVVYSGSGLIGYGKLIIIKHNDTYLSAYAHNDKLLVKEGDSVKGGQQIATMGADSNGRTVLHFEIRRDGQPIDPLTQLPKRHG